MCAICSKRFLYVSSLKKHLQNLHADAIKEDSTDHKWEEFCKIIKLCEDTEHRSEPLVKVHEDPPSTRSAPDPAAASAPPKKPKKKRKTVAEPEEGGETTLTQNKTHLPNESPPIQSAEVTSCKSPPLVEVKEAPAEIQKTVIEEAKKEAAGPQEQLTEGEKCVLCEVPSVCKSEGVIEKTLEERIQDSIKNLPEFPQYPCDPCDHHHIHCEFCGHAMIAHGNHFDYIHDAELHFITESGVVYPHKLAVTEINPSGCRPLLNYPSHANGPPVDVAPSPADSTAEEMWKVWSQFSSSFAAAAAASGTDFYSPTLGPLKDLFVTGPVPPPGTAPNEVERLLRQLQTKVEVFHQHSPTCGHQRVIHGDHVDYLVDGRLHFPHVTHCDDHGPLVIVQQGYFFFFFFFAVSGFETSKKIYIG